MTRETGGLEMSLADAGHRLTRIVAATVLLVSGAGASLAVDAPPDLRLEWLVHGHPTTTAGPVSGRAGVTLRLAYQLRNVGGSQAFAVEISAYTTLGSLGEPQRVEPGPRAGEEMPRWLDLPLARGMREVCLIARLQTLNEDDPRDPNPADNRLCRSVRVDPDPSKGSKNTSGIRAGFPSVTGRGAPAHKREESRR